MSARSTRGNDKWRRKAPWDSPEESATQIRALNSEAFQFFGFAIAAYSIQIALAGIIAAGGVGRVPFLLAVAVVVPSDLLTALLTLAVMARYDLSSLIFEAWPPWKYAEELLTKAAEEHKLDPSRLDVRFAKAWYHKERVVFGGRPPISRIDRFLARRKGSRQVLAIVGVVATLSGSGWWILASTWGNGWPFMG